ncbi:MarR family transcriptional regulator [Conexibacter sp. JD483]|uniref:MarR family winged helix-turn-helix transcriptional regulator n=1 Tax=unclassified Conexibacter TaxID=2627773 RepID=UPI00272125F1|nr:MULTISPECIES: MarR family transcriptional regulator [unclassified Conexibacter]MDO8188781.1 MarR family transcriptional regulator [Conexibacter sp. CPCC 205706]MDO8201856.1 MarR family transcriptional regulator [Conexibacter sp. CPCC 205762]MDR9373058.1 MarR family transcriptional regulator [Conexibacter sp. JD483]
MAPKDAYPTTADAHGGGATSTDPHDVAAALRVSVGMLLRRMRQVPTDGDLTLPESAALARLDRSGPATSAALAKQEQISPQSMGATLAALHERGLIERAADPQDGRRIVLSISAAGLTALRSRRNERVEQLAAALAQDFTPAELRQLAQAAPLIERLAQRI